MLGSSLWFDLFFFKQKTAYEMRISDWSSDVCSSDLLAGSDRPRRDRPRNRRRAARARPLGVDPPFGRPTGIEAMSRTAARSRARAAARLAAVQALYQHEMEGTTIAVLDRKSTRLNSSH